MYSRFACLVVLAIAACGPKVAADEPERLADLDEGGDEGGGAGGRDVSEAIAEAKAALAALDALDEGDEATLAKDRTALASFLADLERCAADGELCPPRVEEPTIPKEYDAATCEIGGSMTATVSEWEDAAPTLAASACGCRTRACAEWILAELRRWSDSLDDGQRDGAAEHETLARECVHRRITGDR